MKVSPIEELMAVGRFFEAKGWAAATSGNYSYRADNQKILITQSGKHKGELSENDFLFVDHRGKSFDDRTPSAETLLHTAIYKKKPWVNCVLHTHSVAAVVVSKLVPKELRLFGYEMLKAYPGIETHDNQVILPIFENSQNIEKLSELTEKKLNDKTPAYIIANHGIYGWGATVAQARKVIEATEYLIECELRLRSLQVRE